MLRVTSVLLLGLLASALSSEETGGQAGQDKSENRIETANSEQMSLEVKGNETVTRLKGKVEVVATQFRVRADNLEGRRDGAGRFEMGFAEGNVRIFLSDTMLKGDRLDYDPRAKKAVLTCKEGKPKAWRAGKVIEATRIVYDLTAKEEAGGERVVFDGGVSITDAPMPQEHAEVFPPKAPEPGKEPGK